VRERAVSLIEEDVAESVRFIRTAVGRLAAIIDGLLRLSRAGRVEYRIQPLPLARILQRIVDAMQVTIASAGAEVRIGPLPDVAGDALAIEQLFANLIGNALAYARPGTPARIDVAVENDLARDSRFTVIRVSDNGLGIPAGHLEKVFQPLQRLHPGVGRGEGMGLAIVRRIIERHDGRVWVRSEVGVGTTFYVELPRSREGESADAA
jgi:signal transduction histidine kinase